nr:reverse transcriptase domain-containing protein [Tanacetum cinerariifolium]
MIRKFLSKYFPPSMMTKLRNEITNFRQDPNESLFEAWEHYKLSTDLCLNHNMLLVTQIDTFYNGLTLRHRDTINAAAGGTFMKRRPKECYDLIKNMTAHHNHWDTLATREKTSRTISSTTSTESLEVVRQLEMMNKNFQDMMKQIQSVKSMNPKCETCGGPHSFTECLAVGGYTQEAGYATMGNHNLRGSGSLPSDTILNSRGEIKAITTRSGIVLDGPLVLHPHPFSSPKEVEHEPEPIIDQNPYQPPIPYPSRLNKRTLQDKSDIQVHKFLQMFSKPHFNISLAEALALISKDPRKFIIPCDFHGLESCMALADLGASINLMPLSVWKKLSLPDLTPTCMILELATRRPFLRTACALVDVHREELILRDSDKKLIFHADSSSKHPHKHRNELINMNNFIDITCKDRYPKVLKFKKSNHPVSGSTTPISDSFPSLTPFETSDSLLEDFADELALLDPFPPGNKDDNFDPKGDLREIEYLLNQDPSTESNIEIIDPIFVRFTDEPALDYLPPPGDNDDDLFDLNFDNEEWKKLLYGDSYNDTHSENNITKDSKTKSLIDEANTVELNVIPPRLLTSDLTFHEESSESFEIATLLSYPFKNEEKVFKPGIFILGGT